MSRLSFSRSQPVFSARNSALVALAFIASSALSLAQNTWYVDVHGTSPGSGTIADPYTSIAYAVERPTTVSGDRVLVQPGTYTENVNCGSKVLTVESVAGPSTTHIVGYVLIGEDVAFSAARLVGFQVDEVALFGSSMERCTMIRTTPGGSRAIFFSDLARIDHCTVVGYSLAIQEFAFNINPLTIRNSVFWNNAQFLDSHSGADHTVEYCAGQAGGPFPPNWQVVGNVAGDPGLWNATAGDVHPRPGSACIDAGDPTSALDADGSRSDIGALPFDAGYGPTPTSYCAGKLNGQGCVPSMSASGHCSATDPLPFWITASQVSTHKFGRLFYGFASASIPFVGGSKCIAPPTTRTLLFESGGTIGVPCSGVLSFDFNARIRSGIDPALVPGRTLYTQYWYRDPADPAGYGVGLSNGLSFGIAP